MSITWQLRLNRRIPASAVGGELVFWLDRPVIRVGRSRTSDLSIKDETVSRRHAEFTVSMGQVVVRDLGSRNGTFVDGRRTTTCVLRVGQEIRFGHVGFFLGADGGNELERSTRREALNEKGHAVSDNVARTDRVDGEAFLPHIAVWAKELTAAQARVLGWLVRGCSEKEIAAELLVSPRTIHNHIQAIYRRLGVRGRMELMSDLIAKKDAIPPSNE